MTTKIAELPLDDFVALQQAARRNRSIMVARLLGDGFRWLSQVFAGDQEALRFRGGLRLT